MKVQIIRNGEGAKVLSVSTAKARNGNLHIMINTQQRYTNPSVYRDSTHVGDTSYGVAFRTLGWEKKPEDTPEMDGKTTIVIFEPEGQQEVEFFDNSELLSCGEGHGFFGYLVWKATPKDIEKAKHYFVSPT